MEINSMEGARKEELLKHESFMVLPFNILKNGDSQDPFNIEVNRPLDVEGVDRSDFMSKLSAISMQQSSVCDHSHLPFIKNYMMDKMDWIAHKAGNAADPDALKANPFLVFHKVKPDHFSNPHRPGERIAPFNYDFNQARLKIGNEFEVELTNNVSIIINEYAGIGYFVIGFSISRKCSETLYLHGLQELTFFRFYRNDEIYRKRTGIRYGSAIKKYMITAYPKQKKKDLASQESNNDLRTSVHEFTVQDFLQNFFGGLLKHVAFMYRRPIMLHLFPYRWSRRIDDDMAYQLLRIPPTDAMKNNHMRLTDDKAFLVNRNNHLFFGSMNDGTLLVDYYNELEKLKNKYFPSFILTLNQREVLLQTNRLVSQISHNDVEHLTYHGGNDDIIKQLKQIKLRINLYQLRQVFYCISFYDEIELFFKKLQHVFNVNLLLQDNAHGIKEINILIQKKEDAKAEKDRELERNKRMEKESKEKKNTDRISLFALYISVLQVLNPFITESNDQNAFARLLRWSPLVLLLLMLLVMFWEPVIVRIRRPSRR